MLHKRQGIDKMTQLQPITRIFQKSTPTLIAAVVAVVLLASAPRSLAFNLTWTNGNDTWNSTTAWTTNQASGIDTNGLTNVVCSAGFVSNVTATCAGGTGGIPSTGDTAFFTNSSNPNVTVTGSTNVSSIVFSNTLVTMSAGVSTLTVTGALRIATDSSTMATVYWGGGTLAVTNANHGSVIQIGTGSNSVGTLFITNGTVICDENNPGSSVGRSILLGTASSGKLVVSGTGIVTNGIGCFGTLTLNGGSSPGSGSQLIVTNGGKVFLSGSIYVLSNGLVLVSGPTSSVTNSDGLGAGTGGITIGAALGLGNSTLIISNGANVWGSGTITIGRSGSAGNTGIVVGAGSKFVSGPLGFFQIGATAGGSSNDLSISDGGFLNCGGGTFTISDSANCINNSLHMGGVGAMSTGLVTYIRNNSGSSFNTIVVTNAVLACSQISSLGFGNNILSVLSKGTVLFSNQYAVVNGTTILTNVLTISAPSSSISINAGTISAVSDSNALGVVIGNGSLSTGASLIITNGGKLLSELGTVGSSSSFCTGIVAGVGSIWSNVTAGVGFVNTNSISVGGGTTFSGSKNFLVVRDGATLVNNGSLDIGDSASTTFNTAVFGGPGAPAVIINNGFVDVGGASGTSGNTLIVTNASLTCDTLNVGGPGTNRLNDTLFFNGGTIVANTVRVRPTNTFAFAAGTLSAGSMQTDSGANSSNVFIVGDGVSAAFYDMAASDTGYHEFGSPGLVVTNGASLRGNGTLIGTTTVLGTFVPGFAGAVGSIFSSNSLSFGNSAVLNYDLGTSSDSVTVNDNLKLGGTLNISDAGGFGPGNYTLFTYAGVLSASGTLTVGTTPNGSLTYAINTNTAGLVILQVTGSGGGDAFTTWQTHYFGGNTGTASGNADPFGKGMSNTNQFLAGFNPTSAAAYLHITAIAKTNGNTDIRVNYLGASGDSTYTGGPASRTNVLEFTTGSGGSYNSNNFASTGQTNILSGGVGLGTLTNMVDPGGAVASPTRYYRVRVLVP